MHQLITDIINPTSRKYERRAVVSITIKMSDSCDRHGFKKLALKLTSLKQKFEDRIHNHPRRIFNDPKVLTLQQRE